MRTAEPAGIAMDNCSKTQPITVHDYLQMGTGPQHSILTPSWPKPSFVDNFQPRFRRQQDCGAVPKGYFGCSHTNLDRNMAVGSTVLIDFRALVMELAFETQRFLETPFPMEVCP